jgi:hypothetical protein
VANLRITDGFRADLLAVESDRVFGHITDIVGLLQTVPTMESLDVPASIRHAYGDGARKIPVGPFDIVTLYDEAADVVIVAGLIHQRAAW